MFTFQEFNESIDTSDLEILSFQEFYDQHREFLEELDDFEEATSIIEKTLKVKISETIVIHPDKEPDFEVFKKILPGSIIIEDWTFRFISDQKRLYILGDMGSSIDLYSLDYSFPVCYFESEDQYYFIISKDVFITAAYLSGEKFKGKFFQENDPEKFAVRHPEIIRKIRTSITSKKYNL
jgi:hypothetical protein